MHCYHTCKNMHEFCTSPPFPHSSTPPSHNCKTIQSLYHNDGMLASFSREVSLPIYFAFPSILISFNLVLVPCYHAAYPQLSSLEIILSLGPPMQQSSTARWSHSPLVKATQLSHQYPTFAPAWEFTPAAKQCHWSFWVVNKPPIRCQEHSTCTFTYGSSLACYPCGQATHLTHTLQCWW